MGFKFQINYRTPHVAQVHGWFLLFDLFLMLGCCCPQSGKGFELGDIQKILKIMTTNKKLIGTTTDHNYQVEIKRLGQLLRDVGITATNKKYQLLMQSVKKQVRELNSSERFL